MVRELMRQGFNALDIRFFKIIVLYVPYGMLVSFELAGIGESGVDENCVTAVFIFNNHFSTASSVEI